LLFTDRRRVRILTIVDACTRDCLCLLADTENPGLMSRCVVCRAMANS